MQHFHERYPRQTMAARCPNAEANPARHQSATKSQSSKYGGKTASNAGRLAALIRILPALENPALAAYFYFNSLTRVPRSTGHLDGVGRLHICQHGVCVKMASAHFNAAELVFYRGLIGIAILWMLARFQQITPGKPATPACMPGAACGGLWAPGLLAPSANSPWHTAAAQLHEQRRLPPFLVGGALGLAPTAATLRPAFQGSLSSRC